MFMINFNRKEKKVTTKFQVTLIDSDNENYDNDDETIINNTIISVQGRIFSHTSSRD